MRLFATKKNPFVPHRDKKELIQVDLSGSQLSIMVPPASYALDDFVKGPTINTYDKSIYSDFDHHLDEQNQAYPYYRFFNRAWGLYGKPWQSERLASVEMSAMLFYVHDLPTDMNCFIPRHFENVLLRYYYFGDGPGGSLGNYMIAPVGWKQLNINGTNYIYSEVHNDFSKKKHPPQDGEESHITCEYFSPIDERIFVRYAFHYNGSTPINLSMKAMTKLRNEIANSIQFKLNPNQMRIQQDALEKNPELMASNFRKPEKWIYPEYRYEDTEIDNDGVRKKVLVTPPSSPPAYDCSQ